MRIKDLQKIGNKYFGLQDLAKILGISFNSAKVSASRYVKQGYLVRIKKNMYTLPEFWNNAPIEDVFMIANLGQTPSYISLTTALSYYEITTQIQQDYIESIVIRRTKKININGLTFRYNKIKDNLYFGFVKEKDFFIATPEKAFIDSIYLTSLGRYAFDLAAIDREKINWNKIVDLCNRFPLKIRKRLEKDGYLKET
ncbi:type IV toxin-antitoxin system AbiEi family antitoxin domain-containing protein [Thermodesulfobacteriota bacterium]